MNVRRSFPDIAMEFFDRFARFENALKRSGYLKNSNVAQADWDRFARDLGRPFFDLVRDARETATLVNAPPKRRITKEGVLEWQDDLIVKDAISLFRAVRRARNNLFHGEKFIGDPFGDDRSVQLLTESLWVLEFALLKHPQVKAAYGAPEP